MFVAAALEAGEEAKYSDSGWAADAAMVSWNIRPGFAKKI